MPSLSDKAEYAIIHPDYQNERAIKSEMKVSDPAWIFYQ